MGLTTNPNSHATAVCCATWGMYLLIRWWQLRERGVVVQQRWRPLGAGLLLGYAATIRYSEATLLLPLMLVAIFNFLRRDSARTRSPGSRY